MSGLEVFGAVVAAADTIDKVIKLVNTIRHAQDQAEVLSSELKSLNVNLQALRRLSANGVPHFDQTSVLAVGADACDRKAQEILRELEGVQKSKREQLKWPFRKDHCEDLLKELRAFSNILHFAISLDTINLLTKSTEEVKKSLKLQVESLGILTEINDAVRRVEHKVEQGFAEVEKAEASRRRDKILSSIDDRLRSLGNTKQDLRHSDISDSRNGRTGSWFLDDSTFKQWLGVNESRDSSQFASNILSNEHALNHADGRSHTYSVIPTQPPNNVFLCQGPPGSGKSTLASLVIEHVAETVTDTPSSMVYYYINYSDKQDHLVLNLVLCFLRQMLQNLSSAASQTMQTQDRLASVLSESSIPKPGVLTSILQQMVQAHSTFYVVLDALDELHLSSQPSVFEFLSDFASQPNVKMFVTTRHTGDLGRVFPSSTAFDFEAAGADIRQYIQDKVVQHNRFAFNPVDDTLKSDMMWQIVSTARGMFLLAKLLLESVLNSVSATTRRETLEKMPKFKDLDSFLEETLDRIREQPNSDRTAIAIDAFLWILHAVRLPRVDDMREALSMSLSDKPLSFENWPQLDLIIDCCQGLVHVGPGGRLLMIHKSVYDYLKGHTPDDWKHRRARLTLQYVKDPAFSKGPTSDLELYQKEHPFLNSLVHGWVTYLEQAYKADWSVWSDLFFQHRPNVSFMYQYNRWHQRYKHQYFDVEEAKSVTPLILICTVRIASKYDQS